MASISTSRSPKQDFFTTFHQLSSKVLSPTERSDLHKHLQEYQHTRDVVAFVRDTSFVWSSPIKLQLLPFVRKLIAERDRSRFDALLGVHEGLVVGGARSPALDKSSSLSSSMSGSHPTGRRGGIHVIKIHSGGGASPRMGFSIRGGSEYGLGIYVSQVDPGSPAEKSGLRCGDQLLEANGVDLENATGPRAAELLGATLTPTLIVRRTRKVPEWKVTKERILWYDVASKKLVALPSGEVTSVKQPGAQPKEVVERRVTLKLTKKTDFVGLNVRGGKEYGLGIYVSRVDRGGLAQKAGICVGDQLVQVNEHHLDNVTHPQAVELLRSNKQLIITAWAIGRFPAYKELFSEYVWSDSGDRKENHRIHVAELHPEPVPPPRRKNAAKLTQRTRTKETRVDRASRSPRYDSGIALNGVDSLHIGADPDIDYDDDDDEDNYDHLELRPELFCPRDQDIIFRGNYSENWRKLDQAYGREQSDSAALGSSEQREKISHNYRPKSVSGTVNSDSDSSDLDMDYTTFLERKMRRDEGKHVTTSSVVSSERNLDVTGGSNVTTVVRQIAVDNDVGHEPDVYRSDVYGVVRSPPTPEGGQDYQRQDYQRQDYKRHDPHTVGQQQRLGTRTASQDCVYAGEPERKDYQRQDYKTHDHKRHDLQSVDQRQRHDYKAVDQQQRHDYHAVDQQQRHDYRAVDQQQRHDYRAVDQQQRHDYRAVDQQQRHDYNAVDQQQRHDYRAVDQQQRHGYNAVNQQQRHRTGTADDNDIYAVVHKPPKSQQTQHSSSSVVVNKAGVGVGPGGSSTSGYYSPSSPNGNSTSSSRSSSEQTMTENSHAGKPHHRHRTHVYHINGSPSALHSGDHPQNGNSSTSVAVVRARASDNHATSDYRSGGGDNNHDDDDYTVVTEVLEEMTTSFSASLPDTLGSSTVPQYPPPPELARLPSDEESSGSSQSESVATTPTLTSSKGLAPAEPTTLDLLSAEIKRLEERQSSLGTRELYRLGGPSDSTAKEKKPESEEKKLGAWSNIKKKLTGSFRVKKGKKREPVPSQEAFSMGSLRKKKGVFERTFGSQMMNQHTVDKYNMMMVEERARQLLNKDESGAVLKHIKAYHENKQLERLVELLLTILDRPEKLQLLKDIRGVIYPYDVGRFDSMVASHEVTAFEKLSTKLHLPLSPVHRQDSASKPRPKLMTTVLDADGHFHIKSVEQHDHETQMQSDVVTVLQQSKSKSFDTTPVTASNSSNNNSYPHFSSSDHNHYNSRQKVNTSPVHVVPPPIEWRDDIEVIIVEKDPVPPPPQPPPPQPAEEGITVYVSKQKKNLGLIVCGGAGDHMDPSVRIDLVMPWGAAADDDRIQAGMHILSVDDQSLRGMTQSEAIAVLKRCFHDTRSVNMKLVLKNP